MRSREEIVDDAHQIWRDKDGDITHESGTPTDERILEVLLDIRDEAVAHTQALIEIRDLLDKQQGS